MLCYFNHFMQTSRRPHLGHNSVHDEGFDGSDLALWVIHRDEEVFGVMLLLLILIQSVLVDHGAGGVGHGISICQGCVLEQDSATKCDDNRDAIKKMMIAVLVFSNKIQSFLFLQFFGTGMSHRV